MFFMRYCPQCVIPGNRQIHYLDKQYDDKQTKKRSLQRRACQTPACRKQLPKKATLANRAQRRRYKAGRLLIRRLPSLSPACAGTCSSSTRTSAMPTCNKIVNLITSSKCKQQRYIGFVSPSMDFVIYPTIRPQYAAMRFGIESTLNLKTRR